MKESADSQTTDTALHERVKELACLYGISELAQQEYLTIKDFLDNVLKLIPHAWQYPENAIARITLDNNHYNSSYFKESSLYLSEKISINGIQRGIIEVFYIDTIPDAEPQAFLEEEKKLLHAIAQKLALIIERKEAVEKMKLLQNQIRHADRLTTIGELTAGIAHEINEPLGNILGFAQLAIKNENLSPVLKSDLEKIIKASLNAREIIKKLMYFSHQMPQRFEKLKLNHVIKEAMYFLESRCTKESIFISYHLEQELPLIFADAIQVNQVIVNLVINAIQAMPRGGELILSTYTDTKWIILKVEDSGGGIPDEIKQHIFKPFFTTKEVGKGTGLGLSVVHGIVTAHQGTITVKNIQDKGASFEVKFPITEK